MRSLPRALLAGGLGLTVSLAVAACGGGSGLLSADQAASINGQLNQISNALASGNCQAVSSATVDLSNAVANLPSSVNPTLRSDLDQGVSTVGQLSNQQCKPAPATTQTSTTSTSTTPTTTSQTTPTSTTTSTTSTTTSTPTTTSTTETTPATPGTTSTGSGGAGLGGGAGSNGNGNGNGNGNANTGGASAGSSNGGG